MTVAMKSFYQVTDFLASREGKFRLMYGDCNTWTSVDGEINYREFNSIGEAKHHCYRRFNEMPIRVNQDKEQLFDRDNPLHDALARIEARFNPMNEIVAVGLKTYLIRRNLWAIEQPISYTHNKQFVYARKDSEFISQKERNKND